MKDIKITSILIFLLLSSCGFKPINQKNNSLIYFNEIVISGDKRIGYNINLSALLKLTNNKNRKEIQKTFNRNADYDVATIHSNTINNEKNATKNLTQQISTEIINFINLSMRHE